MCSQVSTPCQYCQKPLNIYMQDDARGGHYEIAECLNRQCRAYGITLELDALLRLTPEDVQSYLAGRTR